jgi:hypothetical protein
LGLSEHDAANWHPLTWITYFIDRELWAHIWGVYAHQCCVAYKRQLFLLSGFRRVTLSRFLALSVALVFALHPGNVEMLHGSLSERACWMHFFGLSALLLTLTTLRAVDGIIMASNHHASAWADEQGDACYLPLHSCACSFASRQCSSGEFL